MKINKQISEKVLDQIISAAYGDATIIQKISLFVKMLSNKEIKIIYNDYKLTAQEVHKIKLEETELNIEKKNIGILSNLFSKFVSFAFAKPLNVSFASLALLLATVAFFLMLNKNSGINYTQSEMMQAEMDMKYSLAIVGKVFTSAENRLNKEIIDDKIRRPIKKGFQTINTLYNKKEK